MEQIVKKKCYSGVLADMMMETCTEKNCVHRHTLLPAQNHVPVLLVSKVAQFLTFQLCIDAKMSRCLPPPPEASKLRLVDKVSR